MHEGRPRTPNCGFFLIWTVGVHVLLSGYFAAADYFGKSVAVNAQPGSCSNKVAFVSAQDFRNKATFKLFGGFGKQDAFIDHFRA
jgi:hypothetical protein